MSRVSRSCLTRGKLLKLWHTDCLEALSAPGHLLSKTDTAGHPPRVVRLCFSVHDAAKLFPDSLASLFQTNKQ